MIITINDNDYNHDHHHNGGGDDDDDDDTERRDESFLQSPHCTTNCLHRARSRVQGTS